MLYAVSFKFFKSKVLYGVDMNGLKFSLFLLAVLLSSCSSLTIKPVNYAWPVESVLAINENGSVEDLRYSLSFNIDQIFADEYGDKPGDYPSDLRILRSDKGYFFITAVGFKNVYVFSAEEEAMKLVNKLTVSETGLSTPAMNQRAPYVELLDGETIYLLTESGFQRK